MGLTDLCLLYQSKAHSANVRLCLFGMVCCPSDAGGAVFEGVVCLSRGTMGDEEGQVGVRLRGAGSAALAGIQTFFGPSVPVESVTAALCMDRPLFHSPSASPGPQGQQGLSMRLNSHTLMQSNPPHQEAIVEMAHISS